MLLVVVLLFFFNLSFSVSSKHHTCAITVAFKDHNIAVKNKIKKALWGKKKYFFEKLDEHRIQSMTKKAKAQRELERQIRRNKRNEKVMLDFLKKVNGRLLWACFNTWDDERRRIVNLKRMVARSMMGAKRLRFDMWIEYIDIVKELARERDLRNQRVLRETLKKMQNKVKNGGLLLPLRGSLLLKY